MPQLFGDQQGIWPLVGCLRNFACDGPADLRKFSQFFDVLLLIHESSTAVLAGLGNRAGSERPANLLYGQVDLFLLQLLNQFFETHLHFLARQVDFARRHFELADIVFSAEDERKTSWEKS